MKATWPITVHFAADNLIAPSPTKALACTNTLYTIGIHTKGRWGEGGREDSRLFNTEKSEFCGSFSFRHYFSSVFCDISALCTNTPLNSNLRVPMATPTVSDFKRFIFFLFKHPTKNTSTSSSRNKSRHRNTTPRITAKCKKTNEKKKKGKSKATKC